MENMKHTRKINLRDGGALEIECSDELYAAARAHYKISDNEEISEIEIYYSSEADIAGFQFNMDGVSIISASGGDAEANGFSVSTSATTVLGFSFTGSTIPVGCGTLTELTLNQAPTEALSAGAFIKGKNSGATGFLYYGVDAAAGTALTVTETSGNFIKNESLIFNGIQNGRVAIAVTEYGTSDIKSVYGTNNGVSGINTFCADVIQTTKFNVGVATISPASGAGTISTIRSTNPLFPGTGELVRINDLVEFSDIASSDRDPIMARVTSVGTDTITVTEVASVSGVVNGTLPTSVLEVSDLKIVSTDFDGSLS